MRQAAADWVAHGLDDRCPRIVAKNQNVLEPIMIVIGARKLLELIPYGGLVVKGLA